MSHPWDAGVPEPRRTVVPEPWLTVVTVVRNDPDALSRTLDSVRSQAMVGVEHLIIDGASTDATRQLARDAATRSEWVRAVSEPDDGIYDAMNKGLRLAGGRLVQFLNAGDIYSSDDELAWVLRRTGPDTQWLRTRVRFVDFNGKPTRPLGDVRIDASRFRRGRQGVFHQGAFMARELLLELGGFDTGFRIVADFDLMLRALAAGIPPDVDGRVTVDVDAGGVSTSQWRRSLWESHACRTRGAVRWQRWGSWAETCARTVAVGVRRTLRVGLTALAGQERASRWRAGSTPTSGEAGRGGNRRAG